MWFNRLVTTIYARLASIIHRFFFQRPFTPPQKVIIIQPGTVARVMLSTPMLSRLKRTFPDVRFDWAGRQSSYSAISGNSKIVQFIPIPTNPRTAIVDELAFIRMLNEGGYDSCVIPDQDPKMIEIASRADIPQRIGLWNQGRGYRLTVSIHNPTAQRHRATNNLALAEMQQKSIPLSRAPMEFYPSDSARKSVSQRLIDEMDWMGERPLIIMHPGSADEDAGISWPIERYVLLGNRIIRHYNAQILLVGTPSDYEVCHQVAGMIAGQVANWSKHVSLSEIGALTELADLFIGNDTGASHVSAAVGCRTIAIFGPTDPGVSAPYATEAEFVHILWNQPENNRTFDWEYGVTVADAEKAVRQFLG